MIALKWEHAYYIRMFKQKQVIVTWFTILSRYIILDPILYHYTPQYIYIYIYHSILRHRGVLQNPPRSAEKMIDGPWIAIAMENQTKIIMESSIDGPFWNTFW